MSRFTLQKRDGTATFQWITSGRQRVGRVCIHGEGGYLGVIGGLYVRGATATEAFEEVVAQHLKFPSAAALRESNRRHRVVQRTVRQVADGAIREMERNNFAPLEKMMSNPVTATALIGAFTRSLRRVR